MNIVDELNFYDEKMLRLQYEISECFTHQLTKGEVREDFIKEYIKKKIKNIEILKGLIVKDNNTSSQLDMIICDDNVIYNQYGSHYLVEAEFCKHVIEVKSTLKNEYLKKLINVAKSIKEMNADIKTGMFAYSIGDNPKNMLKYFGYEYDIDLDMYYYNSEKIKNEYRYIDYVICIDENFEFVVINENGEFNLYIDKPTIKYLWPILKK